MKTKKLDKIALYNVAYGGSRDLSDEWVDSCIDTIFKSEVSTSSYVVRRDCSGFAVYVRNYRQRDWRLLFYFKSSYAVLQSLYDFLYC